MKCMEAKISGHGFSSFSDFAPFLFAFKTAKISLRTMDCCIVHGVKKFMQVEVDMKCMETKLCGHGLSSFRDFDIWSDLGHQTLHATRPVLVLM